MSKRSSSSKNQWAKELLEKTAPSPLSIPVPLSVIIPVFNCSEKIGLTLESLKRQHYPSLEVIIIDAGSTDHTLEVIRGYHPLVSRIYTVAEHHPFEMLNCGLAFATGLYVTFLFPGTVYIADQAFHQMAFETVDKNFPNMLYCGSFQRGGKRSPRLLHERLTSKLLEKGQQPSTLPACWFERHLFEKIGKLHPSFSSRAGYELFCRLFFAGCRAEFIDRVYVDYDDGAFSYRKVVCYVTDTFRILKGQFNLWKAFRWLFTINYFKIIFLWVKDLFKD